MQRRHFQTIKSSHAWALTDDTTDLLTNTHDNGIQNSHSWIPHTCHSCVITMVSTWWSPGMAMIVCELTLLQPHGKVLVPAENMCIHAHTHTYMHTYTNTHTHTHIHTHMHARMHAHTHANIHQVCPSSFCTRWDQCTWTGRGQGRGGTRRFPLLTPRAQVRHYHRQVGKWKKWSGHWGGWSPVGEWSI